MTDATSAVRDPGLTPPSSTSAAPTVRAGRRRRRPSGEAPPLPHELGQSGRRMVYLSGVVLATWILLVFTPIGNAIDRMDYWIIDRIVSIRTAGATRVFRHLDDLGSPTAIFILRWTVIIGALIFRRFRHLVVFIAAVLVTTWVAAGIAALFMRTRPLGVEILGPWSGFSHPSRPLAEVAVALIGIIYVLVPRGPWRSWAKWVAGAYMLILAAARLYLAVEHPSDAAYGLIIGVAFGVVAFRVFAPTEIFPVVYGGHSKGAHLDVGGRRGEAIKRALSEQLGLDVVEVKPFGLDGSSGSTPLRITLADPGAQPLFGKLYAKNHLRADRSYKLWRTLLYGRLEDESTFSSVRRLVQYEDYLLHLMYDAKIPTARPYGFVEITPEREFLLVTEFFDGAKEIGASEVDDAVIDDGLSVVRQLWTAGLAHRDVKPANVLVRDGRVLLIDVAFAEVRPSPWREAVDLANMMLVLALRSNAEHVYERAILIFTPEEIAEAFSATRSIALTSQLRAELRNDGRDLVTEFRELAPPAPPIRIQRWSLRRVGLTLAVLATLLIGVLLTLSLLSNAQLL